MNATDNKSIIKSQTVDLSYGEAGDIISFAKRIKVMIPNGNKLTDGEAQALAQVSLITQCNPFIGEVWYIPGSGPMIGIKGARRHATEQIKEAGGASAYWSKDMKVVSGEEAGYKGDIRDLAAAYICVLTDSVSTEKFQKLFMDMVNAFREAGDPDPVGNARELLGKRPQWVGYGFSTVSEKSRMNKDSLARKRAEADAIKQRFDIPFGATVAAADVAADESSDWTDAEEVNAPVPSEQEVRTSEAIQKIERPYPPEVLREHVQLKANEHQRNGKLSATDKQRGLVAAVLKECFAGDKDAEIIRKMVIQYLIGYDSLSSTKGAPGIYVNALMDWLKPEKDSGGAYRADPTASAEAQKVYREVLKDSGQIEMEI
jgi:hypothetical protein